MKHVLRVVAVIGSAAALVVTGVHVGVASTTGTVYSACVSKTGALSGVTTGTPACSRGATAISWNRQGAVGPKGDAGSSAAYVATGRPVGLSAQQALGVASQELPAGMYTIAGRVNYYASGSFALGCSLRAVETSALDSSYAAETGTDRFGSLSLLGTVKLASPGRVELLCRNDGSSSVPISGARLLSTQVGSLR